MGPPRLQSYARALRQARLLSRERRCIDAADSRDEHIGSVPLLSAGSSAPFSRAESSFCLDSFSFCISSDRQGMRGHRGCVPFQCEPLRSLLLFSFSLSGAACPAFLGSIWHLC